MMTDDNNQTQLKPDSVLANYRIIKLLGKGGFGLTYLALDKKRNKPVAIKEYFPDGIAKIGRASCRERV